jgi:hypothetical protein
MASIKAYRNLVMWQKSHELVLEIYKITTKGLESVCSVPIYGRLATLEIYRPEVCYCYILITKFRVKTKILFIFPSKNSSFALLHTIYKRMKLSPNQKVYCGNIITHLYRGTSRENRNS